MGYLTTSCGFKRLCQRRLLTDKKVTIEKTDEPDRIDYDVSDAFDKADYLEDMRTYQKPKTKLDQNKIKLYVMILK
jgi:hypothetical protein